MTPITRRRTQVWQRRLSSRARAPKQPPSEKRRTRSKSRRNRAAGGDWQTRSTVGSVLIWIQIRTLPNRPIYIQSLKPFAIVQVAGLRRRSVAVESQRNRRFSSSRAAYECLWPTRLHPCTGIYGSFCPLPEGNPWRRGQARGRSEHTQGLCRPDSSHL